MKESCNRGGEGQKGKVGISRLPLQQPAFSALCHMTSDYERLELAAARLAFAFLEAFDNPEVGAGWLLLM